MSDLASAMSDLGEYLLFTDAAFGSRAPQTKDAPPVPAGIGVVLKKRHNGRLDFVAGVSKLLGPTRLDDAEYEALIEGLELAKGLRVTRIRVFVDRESIVDRMSTDPKASPSYSELHSQARTLYESFPNRRISWVPREMNSEADLLAALAFKK